jgi:tetratricopeptide (TPR) repeat protein
MNEDNEDQLIQDLNHIGRRKQQISETLAFTRKVHKLYLARRRGAQIRLWSSILAGAAAVLWLALVVLPSFVAIDGTSEYNMLYSKFEPELATRDDGPKENLTEILSMYKEGQNESALAQFDSLLGLHPKNMKLLFFKGLVEIELHQSDQAIRIFKQVIQEGGALETYSRWYLALIFLKLENFSACREQLAILREMEDYPDKNKVDRLYRKLRFRRNHQ